MPFDSHSSLVCCVLHRKSVSRNNGQLSAVTLHISTFKNICVHVAAECKKCVGSLPGIFLLALCFIIAISSSCSRRNYRQVWRRTLYGTEPNQQTRPLTNTMMKTRRVVKDGLGLPKAEETSSNTLSTTSSTSTVSFGAVHVRKFG